MDIVDNRTHIGMRHPHHQDSRTSNLEEQGLFPRANVTVLLNFVIKIMSLEYITHE